MFDVMILFMFLLESVLHTSTGGRQLIVVPNFNLFIKILELLPTIR